MALRTGLTAFFDRLTDEPDDPRRAQALEDAQAVDRLFDTMVAHRIKCGLTQRQVAAEMETTQSAVSELERTGGNPKLFTLLRYSRAVGCQLHLVPRVRDCESSGWRTLGPARSVSSAVNAESVSAVRPWTSKSA
jgi:DNA-binding XRE family transcriptional regulator